MPEGPEVEKLAKQLDAAWRDKQISKIVSIWDPLKSGKYWNGGTLMRIEFEKHLQNRTIRAVKRVGKWILVKSFEDETLFAFHLGGTGWFLPNPVDKYPLAFPYDNFLHKVNEQAKRLTFKLVGVHDTSFTEEDWDFYDGRTWAEFVTLTHEGVPVFKEGREPWAGYGPDWIRNTQAAKEKLKGYGRRSSQQAKAVLCDQHITAGIGNYLACEALWRAGVHPHRKWRTLSRAELHALAEKLGVVFDIAQGATNHDWWGVFKKRGELCRECIVNKRETRIEYVKDPGGSRGSYYCPVCQPQSGEVVPGLRETSTGGLRSTTV